MTLYVLIITVLTILAIYSAWVCYKKYFYLECWIIMALVIFLWVIQIQFEIIKF